MKGLINKVAALFFSRTRTFYHDEWNFSITYPADWEIIYRDEPAGSWSVPIAVAGADTNKGRPCFMVNARMGEILQGSENMQVYSMGPDGRPIQMPHTPKEYIQMTRDTLALQFDDFEFISGKEMCLISQPAAKLVYSYRGAMGRITEESITLFGVGITFQFICEVPSSQYKTFWPVFQKILYSFHFGRSTHYEKSTSGRESQDDYDGSSATHMYNRGAQLYQNGDFKKAMEFFDRCIRMGEHQMQATYARSLCQRQLGLEIELPEMFTEKTAEITATYIASNLVCHLIKEDYQAALTKQGSSSEVQTNVGGAIYQISIVGGFGFGGAFKNAWRKEGSKCIPIADSNANPAPSKTDRFIISLVEQASFLPLVSISDEGISTCEIALTNAEAEVEHAFPLEDKEEMQKVPVDDATNTAGTSEIGSHIDIDEYFAAIKEDNLDTVRRFINRSIDVDITDYQGNSALLYVSSSGQQSMAELFLDQGANPSKPGANGFVPLHFAVFQGYIGIVRLLLEHRAEVDPHNPNGYTPLYDAAAEGHIEIVRLLLNYRADINARGNDNSTALHIAAHNGHTKIAELLFNSGADTFMKNDQGFTPLMVAGVKEHCDIMRILVRERSHPSQSCDPDDTPEEAKRLCLEAAAKRQNWDKNGNMEEAGMLFRKAVAKFPGYWMAHYGLGEILSVRTNNEQITTGPLVDEVLSELKNAYELASGRREPTLKLAAEYAKLNQKAAEVVFRKAIDKCDNNKGCIYPIDWQAGDYWSIAISAVEDHETFNLALEAFCRAILINPQYYGSDVRPASPLATAIWSTAKLILPEGVLSSDEEPDIFGKELSAQIKKTWEEQEGRIMKLHNSSLHYAQMFKNKQDLNYLHKALEIENEAWELVHEDYPERYKIASHLGYLFQARYELENDPDDLFKSKKFFQLTISLLDDTDPKRANYYNNLSVAFYRLFEYNGDRANLEQSIKATNKAISITAVESPSMPRFLSDLGVGYLALYRITSAMNDLRKAQNSLEQALEKSDQDSPDRAMLHTHYGIVLRNLFTRTAKLNFLNEAIDHIEKAIDITPDTTAHKNDLAIRFNNLGNALSDRFKATHNEEDLDRSVEYHKKAVKIDANLARKASLATTLRSRYVAFDSVEDLEQCIGMMEDVVDTCNPDSPAYSDYLYNLGLVLQDRYALREEDDDLNRSIDYLKKAAEIGTALSLPTSLSAAKVWLYSAYHRQSWPEAIHAYQRVKDARERIYETQILRQDKESWLYETQGLAAKGAYAYYKENRFREAVEAVEQGLARLLSESLARERLGLERLRSTGNEKLYRKYQQHVDRWNKIVNQTEENIPLYDELKDIQESLHQTVIEIRQVNGFKEFLIPPNYENIKKAGTDINPIVYLLAADLGGVALAVGIKEEDARRNRYPYIDGVCCINLPELTNATIDRILGHVDNQEQTGSYLGAYNAFLENKLTLEQWKKSLDQTTEWLWIAVMSQIVNIVPRDTHVTLIPVGRLSLLPFHAAWVKDSRKACGRRYALDDIVISYAPNAQSLVAAHALAKRVAGEACLGIDDPGEKCSLSNSHREVKTICSLFRRSTLLRREKATKDAVLRELNQHQVADFSCHGKADLQEPLKSKLIMANNQSITLKDLIMLRLNGLRLVTLSACESGMSGTTLPDEFLNLPGGFLEANAAGIVSSLWGVAERSTMLLMIRFYELWKGEDKRTPAQALREAQQWVRDAPAADKLEVIAKADRIIGDIKDDTALGHDPNGLVLQGQGGIEPVDLNFTHPFYWAAFIYVGA